MKRALLSLVIASFGVGSGEAQESQPVREARKALAEDIPQVAVQKLQAYLQSPRIATGEREVASRLLAESLLASGKPTEALQALEAGAVVGADAAFTEARALLALGHFADALQAFRMAKGASVGDLAPSLGETECLSSLGRNQEAVSVLEPYVASGRANAQILLRIASLSVDTGQLKNAKAFLEQAAPTTKEDRNWKLYVTGRLRLAEGQPLPAMEVFEELLRDPDQLTDQIVFGASLGLADARIALSGYDKGEEVVENFIRKHATSRYLENAFRKLDQIYSQQEDPSEIELRKWSQRQPGGRAAYATFYLARMTLREQKYDKAEELLHRFTQTFPTHPLLGEVFLMQADMHLALGQVDDSIKALEAAMRKATNPDQRGEIELRTGIAHYQQGEYLLAANLFQSAGEHSPRLRAVSAYNTALAWLNQRNPERFAEELRILTDLPNTNGMRADLLLEQALTEARNGGVSAEETLQLFLHQNPKHPRAGEARVALAELEFRAMQASANPNQQVQTALQASNYLKVANAEAHTPEMAAQADYLAVFLADADLPRDDGRVIALGEEFLRKYKDSTLIPELRMKLGEVYFRTEDYANAETQFVNLVSEAPGSAYAETALFLAGQSAMKLAMNPKAMDRALGYFDQVVKRDGHLKFYARQEQAVAQSRVGHEAEAIALYEIIQSAQPPPEPELRFAAICGKGDNLATMGRKDVAKLEQALIAYDQLAAAPNVTPTWRNQALYKKARTLEQLGRTPEALTALYDVLEHSSANEREHFWSAKAGFDAGRILETQEQWKAAIGVYNKLAALNGPRAGEAQSRAKQIRLERFVWE